MSRPELYYQPLDCRCTACGQPPGERCFWRTRTGKVHLRAPHAERVTCARDASLARQQHRTRLRLDSPPQPSSPSPRS